LNRNPVRWSTGSPQPYVRTWKKKIASVVCPRHWHALVRRYLEELIDEGSFEVADAIFAPDYVNHSAGPGFGQARAAFLRGIVDMKPHFPIGT
jgi:hypothetical protein